MKNEGRICLGFDEFMLRLGHLKILLRIMPTVGGNRARVSKRFAEELVKPVRLEPDHVAAVGTYLLHKRLARIITEDGTIRDAHAKTRYPELVVRVTADNTVVDVTNSTGGPVDIWYQDWAIAQKETASKVGAVTVSTKEMSNKSGVSHLFDWAEILGVANRQLVLTAEGRVAASLIASVVGMHPGSNSYVIGPERFYFAWLAFKADGDVLGSLLDQLVERGEFTKKDATGAILDTARQFRLDVKNDARASTRLIQQVREFYRDLGLKPGNSTPKSMSTAWHRVSSRMETMVDLGIVSKMSGSGSRPYDYYYAATDLSRQFVKSIKTAESWDIWLETELPKFMARTAGVENVGFDPSDLYDAAILSLGPTGLHIGSFAAAAVVTGIARGRLGTMTEAREALLSLALTNPDVARLSRGYSGAGAEFASISTGLLTPALFKTP